MPLLQTPHKGATQTVRFCPGGMMRYRSHSRSDMTGSSLPAPMVHTFFALKSAGRMPSSSCK